MAATGVLAVGALVVGATGNVGQSFRGPAGPTLLLYSDHGRAPLDVADTSNAAIPTSTLLVLPGVGHLINSRRQDDSIGRSECEPLASLTRAEFVLGERQH